MKGRKYSEKVHFFFGGVVLKESIEEIGAVAWRPLTGRFVTLTLERISLRPRSKRADRFFDLGTSETVPISNPFRFRWIFPWQSEERNCH